MLFKDAVKFASQQMNLPEIYIEKDYWLTYTLYQVYHSKLSDQVVLKGGTALSKCFGLIERFSEDIDLVVLRQSNDSGNSLKEKLKLISTEVATILPEVDYPGITNKKGMIRKTAHSYTHEFEGDFGQVRDVIIIESTWLGFYDPFTTRSVNSFIYDMIKKSDQQQLANEYGLLPFEVLVMEPKRILCEKIMCLVRFSYTSQPIDDLKNKIRHTYDLYQLLQQKEHHVFFQSTDFDAMMLKVAHDDVTSYKNNNDWLKFHPVKSLMFDDVNTVWKELKNTYNGDFRKLVFGELPDDGKVLETLKMIKNRLAKISWKINIG